MPVRKQTILTSSSFPAPIVSALTESYLSLTSADLDQNRGCLGAWATDNSRDDTSNRSLIPSVELHRGGVCGICRNQEKCTDAAQTVERCIRKVNCLITP